MPNRLANETSPYLLQHAENPVDWYPWGPEALAKAQEEDKPILLSVGYSACHWCHVMERESFENKDIAAIMNEHFVSIKVDREERPDIDSIYMTAVQAMTGRGGWPMTVFLTPSGEPFYGGTYFPPEDRHGIPGFPRVLTSIASTYKTRKDDIAQSTQQLLQVMQQATEPAEATDLITEDVLSQAFENLLQTFDDEQGGFGTAPKFPQPMTYEFLLRHHLRTGNKQALDMVTLSLDKMAMGGIYDQIGGGFHRYSVDTFWLVPHFEKMLYDNALLVSLYLHTFQVTGNPMYRRVVEETLDYVLREMTSPEGGFYSAQDADSEGVEGKFYIWHPDEIVESLGKETGELVNRYFDVTKVGNFEGLTILSVTDGAMSHLRETGMSDEEASGFLKEVKGKLLTTRNGRIAPSRDDKIITSWNGLMLGAFAEAASVLHRTDYADVAKQNANFLLTTLRPDGRLLRTYKDGKAKLHGYLEDYAFLIRGLITLHEATFEERWLREAIGLSEQMTGLFWDENSGQFYDTGNDHEALVVRPRDIADNAIPSGNSAAVDVLLRLAIYAGNVDFQRLASSTLQATHHLMTRFPSGAGHWLTALDFYLSKPKEVVIVGERDANDTDALVQEVFKHFMPNRVLLGLPKGGEPMADLPLAEARDKIRGRATAYVCEEYACMMPVNEPEALAEQLGS
ncbi:MAG: thioredoxin domain-containing protein [Chloroflexi bacterium]|nr:thioredoxin domain-containing protein [Chloroflexota bacterium]